jgi:hypothetical protein
MGLLWLSLFIFIPLLSLLSLQFRLLLAHSSPFIQPLCHPDDSSALLQFKKSFLVNVSSPSVPWIHESDCEKVGSWTLEGDKGDCCSWAGVECDEDSGYVIGLHLRSSCLYGSINSNSSLFRLVHLQRLDVTGLIFHPKTNHVMALSNALKQRLRQPIHLTSRG